MLFIEKSKDIGRSTYVSYLIIAYLLYSESTGVVIEEGSTYTSLYSGTINKQCDTLAWFRNNIQIQQCYIENNNIDYACSQPAFARAIEVNLNVINNVFKTNLTILNVNRNINGTDEGVWSYCCLAPNVSTLITFEIKLYHKPHSLQCGVKFQAKGLTLSCISQGIYPQANVYAQTKNFPGNISTCQNVLDSDNHYYNSNCTFTFPNTSLSTGKLEINMTVYPNVTALISDTNFGESRLLTLNLETPKISLSGCPEKDIIEDMPFSCTCERSDLSEVLTNTSWLINGTEQSSSSSTNTVLNRVASRYNTNYTCIAANILGWKSNPLSYIPSVLYASEVIHLLINDKSQNQTAVDNQSTLRILCKALGNPEPSLYLTKNKNQVVVPNKNNFTLSLNYTVSCTDSGIYICSADNKIGEISQKNSTVFVNCAQQLQDPSTNERVLTTTESKDVSLNISVFGYPKPDMYDLIRNGIRKLTINGSIPKTNVSRKYNIAYHADDQNLTFGNVTFTIFNVSSEDFANYTLIISNDGKGTLTYKLSIENSGGSSSREINGEFNWPALGGGLGAAVLVIFIAVLSCNIVSNRSKNFTDDLVALSSEDLYWIDVNKGGYVNYGDTIQAKIYDMEYVSPITTACSPPGNYENFSNRK